MRNLRLRLLNLSLCAALTLTSLTLCHADPAVCHVLDPSGKPVVGATVYVFDWSHVDSPTKLVTDNSGSFRTDALVSSPNIGSQTNCMIVAKGCASSGGMIVPGDNTFLLPAPDTVTGTVVDSKGKPIVGAKMSADYAADSAVDTMRFSTYSIEPLTDQHSTKTTSKGVFTVSDVPAGSLISISASAPGFVSKSVSALKADLALHPITLQVGAFITGKVVREDGKSAGGILVSAGSQTYYLSVKTATDGSFKIDGLPPGAYNVQVVPPEATTGANDWVAPQSESVAASLDSPSIAPTIELTSGALVTGIVLDAVTKSPIPNVQVDIQQSNSTSTFPTAVNVVTDSEGSFTARVWGGQDSIYVFNVPSGYAKVRFDAFPSFVATDGAPLTLPPIYLNPGMTVAGTAVDGLGNPIPNLTIQPFHVDIGGGDPDFDTHLSDKLGQFTLDQLSPGAYYVDAGGDWNLVSPTTFTVPATGPINFVFKKTPEAPLNGTVVDTSGTPVSGVSVSFTIYHSIENGTVTGAPSNVVTDSNGKFVIPNAPLDVSKIQSPSVAMQGYVFQSGGDITSSSGALSITPIVIAQLGGSINGVVHNGLGQPVAGAWVFSPDSNTGTMPVQTDGNGHFTLSDLTVGAIDVYAAKGAYVGEQTVLAKVSSSDTDTIGLSPNPVDQVPSGVAAGKQVLDQAYAQYIASEKDHSDDWRWRDECARDLSVVDHVAALDFLGQFAEVNTGDLQWIIPAPLALDPIGTKNWALPLLQRTWDNGYLGANAAPLGLAIAPYDLAAAKTLYSMAAKSVRVDRFDNDSYQTAAQFVALAYATGQPDADDTYQKVLAGLNNLINQNKSDPGDWPRWTFAEQLALGNPTLALQYLSTAPKNVINQAVPQIVEELAKTNPTAALAALHSLDGEKTDPTGSWSYTSALCNAMPIFVRNDPQDAITQAKAITLPQLRAQALTNIADLLPLDQAAPLYRQAETDSVDNDGTGSTPAAVAAHAFWRDQSLGKELFSQAFAKEIVGSPPAQLGQPPDYSQFAFYYANIDPAFSRLLLEKQFVSDLRSKNYGRYPGDCCEADVVAMSAIDLSRAKQMLDQITDPFAHMQSAVALAAYVVLDQKMRESLSFSAWMQTGYSTIPPPGTW